MRNSDRAWVALAGGVAAYDLIATDDELLTNAARRYFKSQPIATVSMILVTGLHLIGGIPPWCDPITLTFAAYRRLLRQFRLRQKAEQPDSLGAAMRKLAAGRAVASCRKPMSPQCRFDERRRLFVAANTPTTPDFQVISIS